MISYNNAATPPTIPAKTPTAMGMSGRAPAPVAVFAGPTAPVLVGEVFPPVPGPGVAVAADPPKPDPPVRIAGQSVFRLAGSAARYDEATSVGQTKAKQVLHSCGPCQ